MPVIVSAEKGEQGAYLHPHFNGLNGKPECWVKSLYEGCVVENRERNGYDDSDFYAIVWDEEQKKFIPVDYGSTRYWSHQTGCVVDASEELMARYENSRRDADKKRNLELRLERSEKPHTGALVEVVKGRKVPKGIVAWVASVVEGQFGPQAVLQAGDKLVYTAPTNLKVIACQV